MVEIHRDCVDVSILKNIVKDVKTSDIFNAIDQLINEMIETIGKIKQNREDNENGVDMMLISSNILIVLTCKLTLIYFH
jgi:ribosome-associated translation inhibitor RaiA